MLKIISCYFLVEMMHERLHWRRVEWIQMSEKSQRRKEEPDFERKRLLIQPLPSDRLPASDNSDSDDPRYFKNHFYSDNIPLPSFLGSVVTRRITPIVRVTRVRSRPAKVQLYLVTSRVTWLLSPNFNLLFKPLRFDDSV